MPSTTETSKQINMNTHTHTKKARMRQRLEELFRFEVILVYRESARATRTT